MVPPPLWHRAPAVDKPRNGFRNFFDCYLCFVGRSLCNGDCWHSRSSLFGELPKAAQTCLIRHEKSASTKARVAPRRPPEEDIWRS